MIIAAVLFVLIVLVVLLSVNRVGAQADTRVEWTQEDEDNRSSNHHQGAEE